MAVHIRAGASATTALDLWVIDKSTGLLATPFEITYQIFDLSSAAKLIAPDQVFPTTLGDEEPVDLVADKIDDGHFVARYAAPSDEPVGLHEIRWFVTLADGDDPIEIRETFDVIAGAVLSPIEGYALVSALRAEGVPSSISDAMIQSVIAERSRFIERVTGRIFFPFYVEDLPVDGDGTRSLRFDSPILVITTLKRNYYELAYPETIDRVLYTIYNRHITHGYYAEDDRADPRITFGDRMDLASATGYTRRFRVGSQRRFVEGSLAYKITGLFGYTDPDGSFTGGTPLGIEEVCKRLVVNRLTPLWQGAVAGQAVGGANTVKSESTRDQSVTFGAKLLDKVGDGFGELTGDAIADQILAQYIRTHVGMP